MTLMTPLLGRCSLRPFRHGFPLGPQDTAEFRKASLLIANAVFGAAMLASGRA
jgi:hypothetical protein